MSKRATKSGGITYSEWLVLVDAWVSVFVYKTMKDLPEWDYFTAYTDNLLPAEAAKEMLAACKGSW